MSEVAPFTLHEQFKAGTYTITRLALCRVLLLNDSSVPWLILVPEVSGISEIHELSIFDRTVLMEEINRASLALQELYAPDKLNIGALGNIVPQLHIHIIGRYKSDHAWPGPIWGTEPGKPYETDDVVAVCARLRKRLKQ
ncbi:MAG TPA: HIT family protein [Dissulfurispiraceae bacterium]|nr:HIT family protein [Dissulfurispiraceae bacterium]